MSRQVIVNEGSFDKDIRKQINENFEELYAGGTGETFVSPTITGTVLGAATYTAPVLVTPALGTPASGVLSSCTAYPLAALTGAGAGVLAALAVAAGGSGGVAVNGTAGVAAGYKIARSTAPVAVTGTLDIDTGLATVVSVMVTASSDLDGTSLAGVSGVITGAAGHFTAKCWKVTTGGAAGNPTLIAADAAKNVNWIAIGT